jgi:hypothetical protein
MIIPQKNIITSKARKNDQGNSFQNMKEREERREKERREK